MEVKSAIILAGGLGTRLRSEVPDLPKPMAPISGRPFLEYQLDYWITQGISHFVLAVGYRYETIVDYFGYSYKEAKLDYVIEREPLGTGGGFLLASKKIKDDIPFLLLNGDTYFAVDLSSLILFSKKNDADCCFTMFRANEDGRYMGMDVSYEGKIISLKSGNSHSGCLANGGVYLIHPRVLGGCVFSAGTKVSLEEEIFPFAMNSGQRLFGIEFPGIFIDIGVPSDYHRAQTLLINAGKDKC